METAAKRIREDGFKELKKIFFKLNTFYTFLISRKHVLTSFETLKPPIEQAIHRELQVEDLNRIAVLMSNNAVYKYIDMHQIHTETKVFDFNNGGFKQKESDIFDMKNGPDDEYEDSQVLVFEFTDGTMGNSSRKNKTSNMAVPEYTVDQMKTMIMKRKQVFDERLKNFIDRAQKEGKDAWEELCSLANATLPLKKEYMDPVDAMVKAKEKKSEVLLDEETNTTRPTIDALIEQLKRSKIYNDQIAASYKLPKRVAKFGRLNFEVKTEVLDAFGHNELYSHQADAINAIDAGENVIITTSTSSGKSLIYQLAAIDLLSKDPESTFMYIFPTKALAQDQKRAFQQILSRIPSLSSVMVDTYDGDTIAEDRVNIRKNARVIFTNPDMIHASILPNHPNWRHFLLHLRIVVVDELHIYKGLFGSHVAMVMRRLLRITMDFYENSKLQFVSCSATLKRPIDHMKNIFGISQVTLISEDGSPTGSKHLLVWNPPKLTQHMRKRENFIHESAKILVQLILNNVRTIAFCFVRRVCELLMKDVRVLLQEMGRPDLVNEIMSYRGGYSASDRRKIEQEMFHGGLRAVISTNALELGIDIGGLDAVLMCGFPMSLANFHQQSGRAGRRNEDSLTVVVAGDSPVDQHFVSHSEMLVDINNQDAFQELVLDFENKLILEGHIHCAAFELPIKIDRDCKYFNPKYLEDLCTRRLQHDENGYHANDKYLPWPAKMVSLRGEEEDQFAVVDISNGRNIIIEEIEASRITFTLYDGGIYVHQGYPYLVKEVNTDEKYAKVQRVDVDWSTSQRDYTEVDPDEIEMIRSLDTSDVPVYFGKIKTTMVVFGFFKIDKYNKILDAVETHNPPVIINSKGLWINIPAKALDLIKERQLNIAGGIHAAQHAVIGLLPRFIVAGVDEITTECQAPEKEFASRQTTRIRPARLIFYDSKGGTQGSGLSSKVFENINIILEGALQRVEECPCEDGCPDCVAAAFCKERSMVLSKPASIIILHTILGHDESEYIDRVKFGPEPNMPEIKVATIEPVKSQVKFAKGFQIIDSRQVKDGEEYPVTFKTEE
ncbi:HBR298Wp [Eremothecium sinecaudum]|uniref:HBR298Wp n=1 Tax=Eremothecium sinecaudum TaxID=45286 RepID=A0A120K1B1_9SACH|nr:HBR298Wp [Eremothecium sinecaudum]AMD19199.1 HBR298Wp [Eremothecium sinecaudum]